ncbi:MAG: S-adenosylmethionine:tRNA ribosyltransferase-isomerase [Pseudomonadota bacterium]|nr:S-adenosylmethionine:tRNA ribosyltransferase-isomerase [Pseudomonadota bacterium]
MLAIPPELIAHNPVQRGKARLLHRMLDGQLHDCRFAQLAEVLPFKSLLVLNDTKVFPARICAAGFEFLLLGLPTPSNDSLHASGGKESSSVSYRCEALVKPSKKLRFTQVIQVDSAVRIVVAGKRSVAKHAIYQLHITTSAGVDFYDWLEQHGNTPLPPYIKDSSSQVEYQTDYAKHRGSVAAPTAGLHFTREHLMRLQSVGIDHCYLTLHVSAGTFLPIRTANPAEHQLLPERYCVPQASVAKINAARRQGQEIIAVGTTSLRALESFMRQTTARADTWYETDLYLHPQAPLRSQLFSGLITNFHQPSSTLFQLICALIGAPEAERMYQHAIKQNYRFYSFGDSCFFELAARK